MAFLEHLLLVVTACCYPLPAQKFEKTRVPVNSTRLGGTYGLDLSTSFSQSDFECLKGQGYNFAIIRAYRSTGESYIIFCAGWAVMCVFLQENLIQMPRSALQMQELQAWIMLMCICFHALHVEMQQDKSRTWVRALGFEK